MADTTNAELRQIIKQTAEATGKDRRFNSGDTSQTKMESTNFLKSTGLLDGYESIVTTMVEEGWPSD